MRKFKNFLLAWFDPQLIKFDISCCVFHILLFTIIIVFFGRDSLYESNSFFQALSYESLWMFFFIFVFASSSLRVYLFLNRQQIKYKKIIASFLFFSLLFFYIKATPILKVYQTSEAELVNRRRADTLLRNVYYAGKTFYGYTIIEYNYIFGVKVQHIIINKNVFDSLNYVPFNNSSLSLE